jgi:hypothetical protein
VVNKNEESSPGGQSRIDCLMSKVLFRSVLATGCAYSGRAHEAGDISSKETHDWSAVIRTEDGQLLKDGDGDGPILC